MMALLGCLVFSYYYNRNSNDKMSAINDKTIKILRKDFNLRTTVITLKSHYLQPNINSFLNIEEILTHNTYITPTVFIIP